MISSFGDAGTEDIYNGVNTKVARLTLPKNLWAVAQRKLDYLRRAVNVSDLSSPPGNKLEALKGDLAGTYSIRINDQYRVVFQFAKGNAENVQIVDYH